MKVLTRTQITLTLTHLQIQREGREVIADLHTAAKGLAFVTPKIGGAADVVVDSRDATQFVERLTKLNALRAEYVGRGAEVKA